MNPPAFQSLATDGRLQDIVRQAARESLEPLIGVETTLVGNVFQPWVRPQEALALVSLSEPADHGFQGVVWVGGEIEDLATVAETLLGERPVADDDLFQDCLRELANIIAGRIQERLRALGALTVPGLPVYVSGARVLRIDHGPVYGVALQIRVGLPDGPILGVGFVEKRT